MILVDDFLENLFVGELSNLHIGEQGLSISGLSETNEKKLFNYVNQGLKALTSRFVLIQKEVILQAVSYVSIYYLRREYAATSDSEQPLKYLMDSEINPFLGDFIRTLQVFNEVGCELPINEEDKCDSVFTPQFDSVQVPSPEAENAFSIIYQAKHPAVEIADEGYKEIHLPPILEEALEYYVAAKVYGAMNGDEPRSKGQELMAQYEAKCVEAETKDLTSTSKTETNHKACERGWI